MRSSFFEKDCTVFEAGYFVDSIVFIAHGELDLIVQMDNGKEIVLDTLYQGCHFGAYSVLCDGLYNLFGRARTNLVALILNKESLMEYRKVLLDLDDELTFYEQYTKDNGSPICDFSFFFDEKF